MVYIAQSEVLLALINLRQISNKWYTSTEIIQYMTDNKIKHNKRSIYDDLLRLATFNLIEVRGVGLWNHHKEFRGRKNENANRR